MYVGAGERNHYVIGVDVGQKRDYTALAMIQRSDVVYQERSPVTFEQYRRTE